MVAPYQQKAFARAVEQMERPDLNLAMRRDAFGLSHRFADQGAAEWIWQSLAAGQPADNRYEDLMRNTSPDAGVSIAES
jgi:hypothetical protein